MLARIWSASIVGVNALKVGVEVDVSGGLQGIVLVGLPDTAVKESRERVKAAIKNGELWQSRYDNYLQFLSEIENRRETYKKVIKRK